MMKYLLILLFPCIVNGQFNNIVFSKKPVTLSNLIVDTSANNKLNLITKAITKENELYYYYFERDDFIEPKDSTKEPIINKLPAIFLVDFNKDSLLDIVHVSNYEQLEWSFIDILINKNTHFKHVRIPGILTFIRVNENSLNFNSFMHACCDDVFNHSYKGHIDLINDTLIIEQEYYTSCAINFEIPHNLNLYKTAVITMDNCKVHPSSNFSQTWPPIECSNPFTINKGYEVIILSQQNDKLFIQTQYEETKIHVVIAFGWIDIKFTTNK